MLNDGPLPVVPAQSRRAGQIRRLGGLLVYELSGRIALSAKGADSLINGFQRAAALFAGNAD